MNVKPLAFIGEEKPVLFACGECGLVYSPKRDGGDTAALTKAEQCCQPRLCDCGNPLDPYWSKCADCRNEATRQKTIETLRAAEVIPAAAYNDAVYTPDHDGDWGDGYSSCVDAFLEYADPVYCHPCTPTPLALDVETILEHATEEMHEDARSQVIDEKGLATFLADWNEKQTATTWYPDFSKVIIVDAEKFAALLAKGGDA
ncbi:hypothetical protein [Martelella soudanensis]|uniref:hypothetical protein n=1 Tax=unclassified Martelella TaxID=2629616 RepID=UPI0015DE46FB|nr:MULTISPECIES: hypothetical protein [unclassified Martelella]